MAWAKLIDRWG